MSRTARPLRPDGERPTEGPKRRRSEMSKISPFLWYDDKAEEAAEFYVKVFSEWSGATPGTSKITNVARYGEGMPAPAGTAMTVAFQVEGQEFTALNGGPDHRFTDAISFVVSCASQGEVDELWSALTDGGEESMCGWLKDRYGLSWQIIPTELYDLLGDPDPARAQRATQAMLQMQKIDLAEIRRAADAA
jgi:predicted 3-demethylubiquinone-9 3-methyltransferase (glyoxalase superfamily)